MKKNIDIVLTGDNNYVYQLGVVITSILSNLSNKYYARFFLFVSSFSDKDKKEICRLQKDKVCKIIFYDMEKYHYLFDKVDTSTFKLQYISLATYYRLLMLKILPSDVEYCFYIDGDMIVDTDLSKIFSLLSKDTLAAVVIEALAMANRYTTLNHLRKIKDFSFFEKDPFIAPYFNAGFFLINVAKAKKIHLFENAFDFLKRYPNPPYADQDTLNAIIGQKHYKEIVYLPPAYNVFCDIDYSPSLELPIYKSGELKEAFKKPLIYHFAGANKPWVNTNVRHFYRIWWKYAKKTPWYKTLQKRLYIPCISKKKYKFLGFIPLFSISKQIFASKKVYKILLLNFIPFIKLEIKG